MFDAAIIKQKKNKRKIRKKPYYSTTRGTLTFVKPQEVKSKEETLLAYARLKKEEASFKAV